MKYIALLVLLLCPMLWTVDSSAQLPKDVQKKIKKILKEANSNYSDEDYFNASNNYVAARDLGATLSLDEAKKLARSFSYINSVEHAFETFVEIENNLTGEDVFLYASTIHQMGLYDEAIVWYNRSKQEGANTLRVNDLIEHCKWASNNDRMDMSIMVNPCAELLAATQSFGIQYYKDKVVYSSAVEGAKKDKNGADFLNLFCSTVDDNGFVKDNSYQLFSKNLTSPYHVGAICFTNDFKYMYYTKSVVVGDHDVMKIFVVEFDGNDWVNDRELTINSNEYDCAHPALSLDNNTLYFVSNMDGGFGGKDIYYCERKGPNSFGKVKNMGKQINTYEDEVYPVVNRDGKFYFSSKGHPGFGGLDIFCAEQIDGKWQNVRNMMKPFNSNKDDFSYVMDPKIDNFGFVSSNQMGDGYADKIFTVRPRVHVDAPVEEMAPMMGEEMLVFGEEPVVATPAPAPVTEPEPEPAPVVDVKKADPFTFNTTVISTFNGTKIEGAVITITDAATGKKIATGVTDKNGKVTVTIPGENVNNEADYCVNVSKEGYNEKNLVATIGELESMGKDGIQLTPIFNDAVLDDISGMEIPYENDLDDKAKETLDKLAAYLLQNPNIVVKLNGHTEAKGNRYGNLNVSQNMADKSKSYLVSKGVNEDQLIPRGYGERYLKNRCHRGIYCDKSQHLTNRRIEVVVWNVRH
ncbi:MAG: OmpA family protein [Bacteroidales bacterium]|nr:OmpA family protein [Bacteroidales bacterium]